MAFTTLIDTATLADHVSDPAYAIVDCRYKLDDETWGAREYVTRHIPAAVYAHLERDLSGEKSGRNGRHPLPSPQALTRAFERWGIADGVQVIAYDQDTGMYASRLWWLLRWMGHDGVAVLDGGFAKWAAEGRPTASGGAARSKRDFRGSPRTDMAVDVAAVQRLVDEGSALLLDARAPERYRGETEPIDRVGGHIPGAVNLCFKENLDADGTFRSPGELRARFAAVLAGTPAERVVSYCGSGVTACHNMLALERAGLRGARLYAGSWSEWSSDSSRPVEQSTGRKNG